MTELEEAFREKVIVLIDTWWNVNIFGNEYFKFA